MRPSPAPQRILAFHDSRSHPAPPEGVFAPSLVKPALLVEALRESSLPLSWEAYAPTPWEAFEQAHEPAYVVSVRTGEPRDLVSGAFKFWSEALAEAQRWETGSMVAASLGALASGDPAASLSSGFHHAHYHQAGSYCLLNGLVVAALAACETGLERPVLILDCDYHYGNGTDHILGRFHDRPEVKIAHRSLGQRFKKPYQAPDYMLAMKDVAKRIRQGRYGLVIYQAGMDVLRGDPLGGLLTYRETYERDRLVFAACADAATPIAWNLAGGYSSDDEGSFAPTVRGHLNTFLACAEVHGLEAGVDPWLPRR